VFDSHHCYDEDTGKLWMTWGGHHGWITEVDPITGKVVDPATGQEPPSTEFNTHAEGVHTLILTNRNWEGIVPFYTSVSNPPQSYDGDEFQSQNYLEGLGLMKHNEFFYACASYVVVALFESKPFLFEV
jgi:beta-xylosidase